MRIIMPKQTILQKTNANSDNILMNFACYELLTK